MSATVSGTQPLHSSSAPRPTQLPSDTPSSSTHPASLVSERLPSTALPPLAASSPPTLHEVGHTGSSPSGSRFQYREAILNHHNSLRTPAESSSWSSKLVLSGGKSFARNRRPPTSPDSGTAHSATSHVLQHDPSNSSSVTNFVGMEADARHALISTPRRELPQNVRPPQMNRPIPHDALQWSPKPRTSVDLGFAPPVNKSSDSMVMDIDDDRLGQRRLSASEKGKGRAVNPNSGSGIHAFASLDEDGGRTKRVRKKRRLSAAGEIDPNHLNDDGSINKQARAKSDIPRKELRMSADDKAYFARSDRNASRPTITEYSGPCPVWARTRRALQEATDYLRRPIKTSGASVDISPGGIAKGLILEGEAPGQGAYFGAGRDSGTIVTTIGAARLRRHPERRDSQHAFNGRSNHWSLAAETDGLQSHSEGDEVAKTERPVEAPEINALIMAQRRRTPVAVALAQDYSAVPFKVPRPIVVLGWFWVTDAWVEPAPQELVPFASKQVPVYSTPLHVHWKFRFEWCAGDQPTPWWSSASNSRQALVSTATVNGDAAWSVSDPGVIGSTTVRLKHEAEVEEPSENGHNQDPHSYLCPACWATSEVVYEIGEICLNEMCPQFFCDNSYRDRLVPRDNIPSQLRPVTRIGPISLGLQIRPLEPTGAADDINRTQPGYDYWRGWVCKACGMANERRKWKEWSCEACHRSICPERRIYSDEELRTPSRPVCTGPRQDEGFPSWPFEVTRSWTLFADDVKVVKHGLASAFGLGAEVHHALNTEGKNAHSAARAIFKDLQKQGSDEVPFGRQQSDNTFRPFEVQLAPFYTYLCGGKGVSPIEAFGADHAVSWGKAPRPCLSAIDLINERAARMFPGQKERFNSLLITAFPPNLATFHQPRMICPSGSYTAFLYLGSDGLMRFRRTSHGSGVRMKQGQVTVQHGDVIGVRTGPDSIEILPKLDGFGFICIARQAYRIDADEVDGDAQFGTLDSDRPSTSAAGTSKPGRIKGIATPRLPPKPDKLAVAPLTNWYIGARPLDIAQPLRVEPPLQEWKRATSADELIAGTSTTFATTPPDDDSEIEHAGIEVVSVELAVLSLLAPPPPSPSLHNKQLDDLDSPVSAKKAKTTKGAKGRGNTASIVDGASDGTPVKAGYVVMDRTGTPTQRGSNGGGRVVGRARGRGRGRGAANRDRMVSM